MPKSSPYPGVSAQSSLCHSATSQASWRSESKASWGPASAQWHCWLNHGLWCVDISYKSTAMSLWCSICHSTACWCTWKSRRRQPTYLGRSHPLGEAEFLAPGLALTLGSIIQSEPGDGKSFALSESSSLSNSAVWINFDKPKLNAEIRKPSLPRPPLALDLPLSQLKI